MNFTAKVPAACAAQPCVLGVDEAGRGPVLGPMVYACAFWPLEQADAMQARAFDDSKKIKESDREAMFADIENDPLIGFVTCVISADYLSKGMLRVPEPISLNKISQDATMEMIERVIKAGVDVKEIYVDALGNCEFYEKLLGNTFPSAKVTVRPKADSLFKVVSAASICAKVTRDRPWTLDEAGLTGDADGWGSGYPGDEKTKAWLRANMDPVFGFPRLVRFSWQTCKTLLDAEAKKVDFTSEQPAGTSTITAAFGRASNKRVHYFAHRGMTSSTSDYAL